MSMVAPQQRIASAFVVCCGIYGDVNRLRQGNVCRQSVYREAATVMAALDRTVQQQELTSLKQRLRVAEQRQAELEHQLAQAVVLDRDKQAEFATVGQAIGLSLSGIRTLLGVLIREVPSVPTLGRWTHAAGQKAGLLLAVLDQWTRPCVRQAVADEIYVSQPVLMVVEPETLCWVTGRRLDRPVTGAAWTEEFGLLPALEQVARDGGHCLGRGLADLNRQRQQKDLPAVADQLDHFHLLREGGRIIRRTERLAQRAFAALEAAEREWMRRGRMAQSRAGYHSHVRACLAKAERAMDNWMKQERVWKQLQAELPTFTLEGELNTRARAEAVLAELLSQLPDAAFASFKRQLQRPQALTFLDEIERKLKALPVPPEIRDAAVLQEGLKRRPEQLQGETAKAAAMRGMLLSCMVILGQAGEVGQRAVEMVRASLRSSWRASSLVECVNSVVRMQQARHRKVSQELLDLKRLYWNSHVFQTGRRRGQSPYQRLKVPWPEGVRWWDLLKRSPEQLRNELSALKMAG